MKKTLFPLLLLPLAVIMLSVFAKCQDDEQTIELPTTIQNYLSTNYPNYEIEESERDTLCTGTAVYEVELEGPKDKEVELTFDTEGNLLFTETEIKTSELPSAVSGSISSKYAGYTVKEAERLDRADGTTQYEVELKKDKTYLEVLFAADGTVICEETGDGDDDE